MVITWFILFLCACFLVWSLQKITDKVKGRPPGPFRFPIVGCIPQVFLADPVFPFIAFEKLSKYYGSIIYVQFGLLNAVAVNGSDALHEVYRNDECLGRIDDKFMLDRTFGKPLGLIGGHMDIWKESRHFSSRILREFGFGVKKTMEGLIQEELESFSANILQKIQKTKGVLQIHHLFDAASMNVTWSMISGTHFGYDDRKLTELMGLLSDYMQSGSLGAGLLTSFPFLLEWAPKLVGFDIQAKANKGIQKYLQGILDEVRSEGHYRTNPSNFIEVYLQKVDKREPTGSIDDVIYSDENLISILYDFFTAGSETSSHTLEFAILNMILHPAIQDKVRDEIAVVTGNHRCAALLDKEKLPYTEATILEIFRTSNVIALSARKLHVDATIGKFRLPKGTTLFMNLHSASMDKDFWGDPEVFRPERFLNPEGKIINSDRIIPFGYGKRNCLGEGVARATIFIMFTGLIQKFNFEVNPDDEKPTRHPVLGFSLSPKPFTLVVSPRQ